MYRIPAPLTRMFSGIALGLAAATLGMNALAAGPEAASPYPEVTISPANPALAAQVKHGEYLVDLGDCLACHTASGGKAFSGGRAINTPYGAIYSTNITPDPETGIGKWTFAQFDKAVRYGDSPHGYLFAAMPYPSYNIMSPQQVRDMWEYLKRVPAVYRRNEPVGMPIPFRWRFLQAAWRLLFFKPADGPYRPDPTKSALWNWGRFIVEGPEHCGACHTPHNFLGAPKQRYFLTGSTISGRWAPDVSGAVTSHLPVDEIMKVFSEKRGLSGGVLGGDMGLAIGHSMRFMTPQDMRAVAVYLQTVDSPIPSGPMPVAESPSDIGLGQKVYRAHCAACHETGVGGAPKVGTTDFAPLAKMPLEDLYRNVHYGVSIMPAKGGCAKCTDRELSSAIRYMIRPSASPPRPGASRPDTT